MLINMLKNRWKKISIPVVKGLSEKISARWARKETDQTELISEQNLLNIWESSIKQIFHWKLTYLISKLSFF